MSGLALPFNADDFVESGAAPDNRPLTSLIVSNRHRRDLGNLADLTTSMDTVGLLHPVVITLDNQLIAGARRLAAADQLHWSTIPVRVVETLDDVVMALKAEIDENTCRKDLMPSEKVALARDLEPLERQAALERHAASAARGKEGGRGKKKTGAGNSRTGMGRAPVAKDQVASAVGFARKTLAKADAVVEAAELEPDKFAHLLAAMDRSGNVHAAFRRLDVLRQAEAIAARPTQLPDGPFDVVAADPAWRYPGSDVPYPDMSVDDICKLPVSGLAAENCVLWFWTTNHHMRESFTVLDAWGFTSKALLTWGKQQPGTGQYLLGQTEHCHLAVRGKPLIVLTHQSTLLLADRGAHSVKPEAFYQLVETMCPGSKIELFARRKRPGWSSWGSAIDTDAVA